MVEDFGHLVGENREDVQPFQGSSREILDSRGLRPWLFHFAPLGLRNAVTSEEKGNMDGL